MPAPSTIAALPFGGFSASGVQPIGPFQNSVGNAIYVVTGDNSLNLLHVWRSTDDGVTWAKQNLGGEPTINTLATIAASYDDTTKLITIFFTPPGAPTFSAVQFNVTTNTFGAAVNSPTYAIAGAIVGNVGLCVKRNAGDFIVFFSYAKNLVPGFVGGLCFVVWSTITGWTASPPIQITTPALVGQFGDCDPNGIVSGGASGRVHVFAFDAGVVSPPRVGSLYHFTIESNNTFTAGQVITSTVGPGPAPSPNPTTFFPVLNTFNNQLAISYNDLNGVWRQWTATEADVPAWVLTTLDAGAALDTLATWNSWPTIALPGSATLFAFRTNGTNFRNIELNTAGVNTTAFTGTGTNEIVAISVGVVDGQISGVFSISSGHTGIADSVVYLKGLASGGGGGGFSGSTLNAIGVVNGGTCQDPVPVIPERRIPKASQIIIDLQPSQNTLPLWIEIALHGVKLFPKGSQTHYTVDKTKPWRVKEYTYSTILPAGAPGTNFFKQPVILDGDSAFMLQAIYSTTVTITGYSFKFYGPRGEELETCLAFAGSAPPQPSFIGGGNCVGTSRRPRTLNPPVLYPPAGVIAFDYRIPTPAPPNDSDRPMFLCFTGLRLYGRWL